MHKHKPRNKLIILCSEGVSAFVPLSVQYLDQIFLLFLIEHNPLSGNYCFEDANNET